MDNTLLLAVISSSAFAALITNLFGLIKDTKRQRKVNQILLLGELDRRLDIYRHKGSVGGEQLQLFNQIVELYHAEGGNGYADSILDEVRKLPRV